MSVASWCSTCFCVVLSVGFVRAIFVMVPLNPTYLHCLQHIFFEHLFYLYLKGNYYFLLIFNLRYVKNKEAYFYTCFNNNIRALEFAAVDLLNFLACAVLLNDNFLNFSSHERKCQYFTTATVNITVPRVNLRYTCLTSTLNKEIHLITLFKYLLGLCFTFKDKSLKIKFYRKMEKRSLLFCFTIYCLDCCVCDLHFSGNVYNRQFNSYLLTIFEYKQCFFVYVNKKLHKRSRQGQRYSY